MSKFFITRPIFAAVISIIIVLAGIAAALKLSIAQYPQIAPPTVVITASYPGASAETLSKTVAGPIEEQLSGVKAFFILIQARILAVRLTLLRLSKLVQILIKPLST